MPSLELNSSSHFSLVDEDAILTIITLKEEVSEINKQNQLISVPGKTGYTDITEFFVQ